MADKYVLEGKEREVEIVDWRDASALDQPDPVRVGVKVAGRDSLRLRIGNQTEQVMVVKADAGAWVWHQGRARFVEDEQAKKRRQRKSSGQPGAVTPPMPATVVKILVEVGQSVEQSQPLVIVSAMKMETTLSAPHAGTVTAINAEVGASVKPGEILVDLAEAEPPEPSDESSKEQ